MIKLKKILNEIKIDGIEFLKYHGKSDKNIDTHYIPPRDITTEKIKEILENQFIKIPGYRGISYKHAFKNALQTLQYHLFINPGEDFKQKSVDTNNLYYILFENLPSWKSLYENKHRSNSIKFTNNLSEVVSEYMKFDSVLYRIYPKKDAKIFCSEYYVGFLSMPYVRKIVYNIDGPNGPNFSSAMSIISWFLSYIINYHTNLSINSEDSQILYDKISKISVDNKENVENINFENVEKYKTQYIGSFNRLKEYFLNNFDKYNKTHPYLDFLDDLFDPEKNGIKLVKADSTDFHNMLTDKKNIYEFWTTDICYVEPDRYSHREDYSKLSYIMKKDKNDDEK